MRKLLYLVRFVYNALLLIALPLLIPRFEPGGRYLILLDAALIALLTGAIRWGINQRLPLRVTALLGGLGLILGLALINRMFRGVILDPAGLAGAYLGVVGLEMLLPGRLAQNSGPSPENTGK